MKSKSYTQIVELVCNKIWKFEWKLMETMENDELTGNL